MAIFFQSNSSDVSAQDAQNAHENLKDKSAYYKKYSEYVTSNSNVLVAVSVSSNQPDAAFFVVTPDDTAYYPQYDYVIWIPTEAFDGNTYNSGDEWTFERLLAHEMVHAVQEMSTSVPEAIQEREQQATDISDYAMKEAYPNENSQVNYYTPEGNPNTTPGSGIDPFDNINDPSTPPNPNFSPISLPDWVPGVTGAFGDATVASSPLVLDLDGDGIELAAVNGVGSVYWDIDNDGFREASGWASGGDGLLCVDVNNDGVIVQSELFGNDATYANGYLKLDTLFDTNNTNTITSADAGFGTLRVWIDANADGVSQSTELKTLASLGITSISSAYTNTNYQIAGNDIKQQSTFIRNGVTRTSVDAANDNDQRVECLSGRRVA